MFLNCGEFVETNSDLLATHLMIFQKLLQMCCKYRNFIKTMKKIRQRQSWANYGSHADLFFCSSLIFSGKIVDLRTCRPLFFIFAHQCFVDPHFPKTGDCVKKVEDHWSRLYGKNFFGSLDQSKTIVYCRPANSEKNVDLDSSTVKVLSMLLLIHQPLLKVAWKMKTVSPNVL